MYIYILYNVYIRLLTYICDALKVYTSYISMYICIYIYIIYIYTYWDELKLQPPRGGSTVTIFRAAAQADRQGGAADEVGSPAF